MAKSSSVQKNNLRSKLIDKYKSRRQFLKSKIKDKSLTLEERILFQTKLNELPRNSSSIRHRNRRIRVLRFIIWTMEHGIAIWQMMGMMSV